MGNNKADKEAKHDALLQESSTQLLAISDFQPLCPPDKVSHLTNHGAIWEGPWLTSTGKFILPDIQALAILSQVPSLWTLTSHLP